MLTAPAQLTDKMDAMYIIPKGRPELGEDAHVICFSSVTNFGHQGPKTTAFLALAQLTDKIDPMYIIPKDRPEPLDDAHVICFSNVQIFATRGPKKCFFLL